MSVERSHRWCGVVVGVLLAMQLGVSASRAEDSAPVPPLSTEAQALIPQLDSPDDYARRLAFLRLEALREPASADLIRPYLGSRDPETRSFAVRALAAVEGVKAVPYLLEQLTRDKQSRVRVAAILALEPLAPEDPQIVPALIDRLRDRKPDVRMAAVDAVSRFDLAEARQAVLLRARRENNRDVQRVLAQAVARISDRPKAP